MIYFEKNKTTVKWIFSKEGNFNVSIITLFRMNQNKDAYMVNRRSFKPLPLVSK